MNCIDIRLGNKKELTWALAWVKEHHYLHQPVAYKARPMVYLARIETEIVGLVMVASPHATKNRGWWGYPGELTQWQVVDLARIWASPKVQAGGEWCRPALVPGFMDRKGIFRGTFTTWMVEQVLNRIQKDRVAMYPPVYPEQPYHIRLVISYHDPAYHRGLIYRVMDWEPMYADEEGKPLPKASGGKYGWCWRLPEPAWKWNQIRILRPRTMRLPLM